MLILTPGAQNGIHFSDPCDPGSFKYLREIPVHPREADEVDILKRVIKKDRPPFEVITENEVVVVTVSSDIITVQECDQESECEQRNDEFLLSGATIVLFPNRKYAFKNSGGITFLTFVWLSRS